MASGYFEKLFSEQWSGRKGTHDSPREIEVTDDTKTVMTLCRILHHMPPHAIGAGDEAEVDLLALAMLADKYDCIDAVRILSLGLLEDQIESLRTGTSVDPRPDPFKLAAAAYIFDQPKQFRYLSKCIVMSADEISHDSFPESSQSKIPAELVRSLVAQRACAREQLTQDIAKLITRFSDSALECKCSHLIAEFLHQLKTGGLFPLSQQGRRSAIHELTLSLDRIQMPIIERDESICSCVETLPFCDIEESFGTGRRLKHIGDQPPYVHTTKCKFTTSRGGPFGAFRHDTPRQQDIHQAARSIREICVGVCLDCIKAEATELPKWICRSTHPRPWEKLDEARPTQTHMPDIDSFLGGSGQRCYSIGFCSRHYLAGERPRWWQDQW